MPRKANGTNHAANNRSYEQRRQATGLARVSVWVPEADRETFVNAAKTYVRLHEEKRARLKPSS